MSEHRKTVDSFLAEISAAVGKNIRLNEQGICAFTYENLTIVIEVPESVGSFFIYSSLFGLAHLKDPLLTMKKCLQMNYLQQETRGGCLSIDPVSDELMFSYTDRIHEINATDFRNILENFIDTGLNLYKEIDQLSAHGSSDQSTKEARPPEMLGYMQHHFMP